MNDWRFLKVMRWLLRVLISIIFKKKESCSKKISVQGYKYNKKNKKHGPGVRTSTKAKGSVGGAKHEVS